MLHTGKICTLGEMLTIMVCRFKNMDKLIHYANKDGRLNVFYSSPDAYTDAKNSYNTSWPLKTDDFFPYADCPTCYWTGLGPSFPRAVS